MIRRIVEAGIVLAGGVPLVLATWLVRPASVEPMETGGRAAETLSSDTASQHRTLGALAMRMTPFRASGQPPLVRFGAVAVAPESDQPAAVKPAPVLTGILWGSEPAAILEGLPGMEAAALVRSGDRIGPLRVRRITRDRVELVGMDTTWVLRVREPWR